MGWHEEIVELHRFFEAYYLGRVSSLSRAEAAFHPDFTFAGPNGETADRAATLDMLRQGHGHTAQLRIVTSEHRLLFATDDVIVAAYVERHELLRGQNERLATAVFVVDEEAPNNVRWLRVHESWIGRSQDGTTSEG